MRDPIQVKRVSVVRNSARQILPECVLGSKKGTRSTFRSGYELLEVLVPRREGKSCRDSHGDDVGALLECSSRDAIGRIGR